MPGSKFKLLPGIIVPNRKNAICQFWSNRAFLFTGAIVDKPKARTIIMTGERYFFFDKRYLSGTWGRSFSAGSWGHSLRQRCIECSGKCGPVFGRIMGRGFRMGWVAESATRKIAPKRDAVSLTRLKRKAHPISELQNGMRFPRGRIVAATLSGAARYSPKISAASSSWVSTT